MYKDPTVTEITPFKNFYKADPSHQNFYDNNKQSSYCRIVIDPKIQKLMKNFKEYVR